MGLERIYNRAWKLETNPSYGEPLKFRPNEEDGQKLAFNFVFNSF